MRIDIPSTPTPSYKPYKRVSFFCFSFSCVTESKYNRTRLETDTKQCSYLSVHTVEAEVQTDDILVEAVEGYINHTLHPMVCTTPQTLRVFNAAAISCEELENPTSHRTDAVVLEIADSKSTNTQSLDETDDCVSQASNT